MLVVVTDAASEALGGHLPPGTHELAGSALAQLRARVESGLAGMPQGEARDELAALLAAIAPEPEEPEPEEPEPSYATVARATGRYGVLGPIPADMIGAGLFIEARGRLMRVDRVTPLPGGVLLDATVVEGESKGRTALRLPPGAEVPAYWRIGSA